MTEFDTTGTSGKGIKSSKSWCKAVGGLTIVNLCNVWPTWHTLGTICPWGQLIWCQCPWDVCPYSSLPDLITLVPLALRRWLCWFGMRVWSKCPLGSTFYTLHINVRTWIQTAMVNVYALPAPTCNGLGSVILWLSLTQLAPLERGERALKFGVRLVQVRP